MSDAYQNKGKAKETQKLKIIQGATKNDRAGSKTAPVEQDFVIKPH